MSHIKKKKKILILKVAEASIQYPVQTGNKTSFTALFIFILMFLSFLPPPERSKTLKFKAKAEATLVFVAQLN